MITASATLHPYEVTILTVDGAATTQRREVSPHEHLRDDQG
jgi:hypothetical protein